MYRAAYKAEFQPFNRSYSQLQLTYCNILIKSGTRTIPVHIITEAGMVHLKQETSETNPEEKGKMIHQKGEKRET